MVAGCGERVHFINEKGFSADSYAGVVDKLAHFYIGYTGTRLLIRGLEWAGNGHDRTLQLAALTMGGIQLRIEIMYGFDTDSGFSTEDAIANLTSLGLGVLLERNARLDKIFDLRVRYFPSQEARRRGNVDPFGYYSGQMYLLIAKSNAFPLLARHRTSRHNAALGRERQITKW